MEHIKTQWCNISNMSTYNGCNILSRNAKNITFLSKPFQNGIRCNAKFTVCSSFQCTEKIILIFINRLNVKLRVNDSLKICLCFSLLTMSRSRWAHTVLCFHASNTAIILLLWVRLSKRINIKRCSYQHISIHEKRFARNG